jgi:hypothetical protein
MLGVDIKSEEILLASITKNPNIELQAFCNKTLIGKPLEFKRIQLLNTDPKVQQK